MLLAALLAALWLAAAGQWGKAGGAGAVALIAAGMIALRYKLPAAFGFLIAVAAAVNAAGYIAGLWHEHTPFDEAVHGFTSFVGMFAIGWLVLRRGTHSAALLIGGAVALGLVIGVLWEVFEWAIGIIGDRRDTLMDLVMDGLGAAVAGVLVAWLSRAQPRWMVDRERTGGG